MEISREKALELITSQMKQVAQELAWAGVRQVNFKMLYCEENGWDVSWEDMNEDDELMEEMGKPIANAPSLLGAMGPSAQEGFALSFWPLESDKKTAIEIVLENAAVFLRAVHEGDEVIEVKMSGPLSIDEWPDFTLNCSGELGLTTLERSLDGSQSVERVSVNDGLVL